MLYFVRDRVSLEVVPLPRCGLFSEFCQRRAMPSNNFVAIHQIKEDLFVFVNSSGSWVNCQFD
jgi:hypothetical protein